MLLIKPQSYLLIMTVLVLCSVEVKAKNIFKFQDFLSNQGSHELSLVKEDYKKASSHMGEPIKREIVQFQAICQNNNMQSIIRNYLEVNRDNPMKVDLIREFLGIKYLQYYDLINSIMSSDSQQGIYDLKILSIDQNRMKSVNVHGIKTCDLDEFAHLNLHKESIVNICPWHWVIYEREDRYPFTVPTATCNCANCHASTSYDNKKNTISSCTNNFVLRPVMYRETTLSSSHVDEEIWMFGLERVPISCSCSLKIQTF